MKERQAARLEIEGELQQLRQEREWFAELQRLAVGRALVTFDSDAQCLSAFERGLTPKEFLDEVLMDKWHDEETAVYERLLYQDLSDRDAYEEAERWERWEKYEPNWWDDREWSPHVFEYGGMVYDTEHGSPSCQPAGQ